MRSARTTDPKILLQLSDQPILAFSGAHPKVTSALEEADLLQLTETSGNVAYERDDARSAPHNLFVATRPLFNLATKAGVDLSLPPALFRYGEDVPHSQQASLVRDGRVLQFERGRVGLGRNSVGPAAGRRADALGGRRGDLGRQRRDPGVVVTESDILDVTGPVAEVELLGEGRACILRDGRLSSAGGGATRSET